jgi:hypothetical protein
MSIQALIISKILAKLMVKVIISAGLRKNSYDLNK